MAKYFVEKSQVSGVEIIITGDDAYHLGHVLRIKPGEKLKIGVLEENRGFLVEVSAVFPERIHTRILGEIESSQESPVKLRLFQGLAKGEKMDLVVQKAVELGVAEFVPFSSSFSVVKLDEKKEAKRVERWQKIAHEAAKQCQRDVIPQVLSVYKFSQVVDFVKNSPGSWLTLVPYERETNQALGDVDADPKGISIIIGPEGGFSQEEVDRLSQVGAKPITLGPRILRTETAGLVALSLVGYRWGDLA